MRTTPRPPLTKRLRPAHWTAIDCGTGFVLGLIIFAIVKARVTPPVAYPVPARVVEVGPTLMVRFAAAVAVVIAVATRRKHPMASLSMLLGCSIMVTILSGGAQTTLALFVPTALVLFLIVATFDDRRSVGQALTAVFLVMIIDAAIMTPRNGLPRGGVYIPVIFAIVTAWALGYIVRQRRSYAVGLQEEAASKAVAVERLRIARELHDIVAHSMSVIAVQAGYGQYVIDTQPADARQALGAIQATSREALEEMRRMLGALRYADETGPAAAQARPAHGQATPAPAQARPAPAQARPAPVPGRARPAPGQARPIPGQARPTAGRAGQPAEIGLSVLSEPASAAPLYPAPGLADLDRLLARTAGAGVRAEVHRLGTPRDLPSSIDLSAYRIVQEALTNVVKHAHASRCSVLLDYGDDELTIEVTDSGAGVPALAYAMAGGSPAHATPSGGHGIIGMRERVSLLGGTFTAEPLPGYGFQVSARIPLPEDGTR